MLDNNALAGIVVAYKDQQQYKQTCPLLEQHCRPKWRPELLLLRWKTLLFPLQQLYTGNPDSVAPGLAGGVGQRTCVSSGEEGKQDENLGNSIHVARGSSRIFLKRKGDR